MKCEYMDKMLDSSFTYTDISVTFSFGSKRSMEKLLSNLANRVVDQLNASRLRQMMKVLQIPADFESIINHQVNEQIRWQERNLPLVRQTLQQYTYQ